MNDIDNFKEYVNKLSYYNAADSYEMFKEERERREECRNICIELRDELLSQGIDTNAILRSIKNHLAHELLITKE